MAHAPHDILKLQVPSTEVLWNGSIYAKDPIEHRKGGIAEQVQSAWKPYTAMLRTPQRPDGPLRLNLYPCDDTFKANASSIRYSTVFYLSKEKTLGLRLSGEKHKLAFVGVIDDRIDSIQAGAQGDQHNGQGEQSAAARSSAGLLSRLLGGIHTPAAPGYGALGQEVEEEFVLPMKTKLYLSPLPGDITAVVDFMKAARNAIWPPSDAVKANLDLDKTFEVSLLDTPDAPLPHPYKHMYGYLTIEQRETGWMMTMRAMHDGEELFSWSISAMRQSLVLSRAEPRDNGQILRILTDRYHPLGNRPILMHCDKAGQLKQALSEAAARQHELPPANQPAAPNNQDEQ